MRQFLLKNADRYDLQAVKEKAGYADLNLEFRSAIEKALKAAAPGGTRTRTYDIQTVGKLEETFKELRHDGITTEIANLISAYVTVDAPTRREGQTASKKATKKVASDVTNTPTTKTESSKLGKRKRAKGRGKGKGKKKGKKVDGQVINSGLTHQQLNFNSNQRTITSTKDQGVGVRGQQSPRFHRAGFTNP